MQRICSSLADDGYKVRLVGRELNHSEKLNFKFRTKRIRCFFNRGKAFYIEYNLRLFFYLLFKSFDAICAIDLDTIMPAWAVARIKGKKLGFDAHEYFQEVPEVVDRDGVKQFWERIAAFAIPKTDFRYTVSASLAREFRKLYGVDFDVIRNLPLYQHIEASSDEAPFLLYQGALNAGRGLETLIRSAANLPVQVKIAGEGDLSKSLRKLASDLGLEDKVEFLGYLKPDELKSITPKAFLGYNLFENKGLSYFYSLNNKFFDYTMAGVPCLSPDFPEYSLLRKEYKIGVIAKLTEEDIYDKVESLLVDPVRYSILKSNAFKAAETLNWQEEEKILLNIYKVHLAKSTS